IGAADWPPSRPSPACGGGSGGGWAVDAVTANASMRACSIERRNQRLAAAPPPDPPPQAGGGFRRGREAIVLGGQTCRRLCRHQALSWNELAAWWTALA